MKVDPTLIDAWLNLGVARGQLKRYEEALNAFDEALKIDPKYAPAWFQKAVVLGSAGVHDRAGKALGPVAGACRTQ